MRVDSSTEFHGEATQRPPRMAPGRPFTETEAHDSPERGNSLSAKRTSDG